MITIPTAKVLADVHRERQAQDDQWGEQNHDWGKWHLILSEEVGEAAQEMLRNTFSNDLDHRIPELREELVQTAAVAVAIIEYVDRTYEINHDEESN